MEELLLSYGAGTAIAWEESGAYRRDKIFSWTPKESDYFLVQEEALVETNLLLRERPMGKCRLKGGKTYYLFRAPEIRRLLVREGSQYAAELLLKERPSGTYELADGRHLEFRNPEDTLKAPSGTEAERMLAILTRDYPSLAPRFLEKWVAGRLKATLTYGGETAHLGNSVSGTGPVKVASGHRDLLFKLSLKLDGELGPGRDLRISYVELRRQNTTRTFASNAEGAALRVALEESGEPLAVAQGAMESPLSDGRELWLRVCDDGKNAPDATYRCRVKLGEGGWVVSDPVSVH
jgi:hypothetical protein